MNHGGTPDSVPAFLSHRVVLRSSLSYAERVRSVDLAGRPMERRVCFFLQQSIPELWMRDRIVLALDADEFLMRPPQLPDADALLAALESHRIASVGASLLEFSPPPPRFPILRTHGAPVISLICFRWRGGLAGTRPSASTRFFREVVIAVPYTTTPFKVLSIVIGVIGLSAVTRRA